MLGNAIEEQQSSIDWSRNETLEKGFFIKSINKVIL